MVLPEITPAGAGGGQISGDREGGIAAAGRESLHRGVKIENAHPTQAVEEQFMESFARVMEQRRSGASSRASSRPASVRAASKPASEGTRDFEGDGALAFAVAMTGSSRGSSMESSQRASPLPSPGRSSGLEQQQQRQQGSLPSSRRASPLPSPRLGLDLHLHSSLASSGRISPLPCPKSRQQAENGEMPEQGNDPEENAATPSGRASTLAKNAGKPLHQRRPRVALRPLPRVIESDPLNMAKMPMTVTVPTTAREPLAEATGEGIPCAPEAEADSHCAGAGATEAGIGQIGTGHGMTMDEARPLCDGACRDGQDVPHHAEQELSFTVGTMGSTEDGPSDGTVEEKTVEEICRECNDRVEEALESGGDALLCRTLLTVTRRLVDLDQDSKALTSRTYYNLGRLHRSLGEYGEAQRNLEASIAAGARPGIERPVVYLELCETFAQQCRWEESLAAVSRAVSDILTRLGLSSVHEITEDSFRPGHQNAWLKDAGKGWTEGGDFEGPSWLGRVLALMLHRQGEIRQELNAECISCFERAMFVAKNLGTAHSDVAAHTRESYVVTLQRELSSSTGGQVHIGAWDENCPPENRWSRTASDRPRRLLPMVHGSSTKSSGGPSKQLKGNTGIKGNTGLAFPSKPRQSKVPESPFFIQLASSKALVVQCAYRAHLARIVRQRRMTSWRGLKEILMVRRIQKIWRGIIARRKRAEIERLEELARRRSAALLLSTYCIRKLVYFEDVRRLRDHLIGNDKNLAKRVDEFTRQSRPQPPPPPPLDVAHSPSAGPGQLTAPTPAHMAKSEGEGRGDCGMEGEGEGRGDCGMEGEMEGEGEGKGDCEGEIDNGKDDARNSEAMVLWRAYHDAGGSSSISSFLESFGYTEDDLEAFFEGCGPSLLGDGCIVPADLFFRGATALLEHVSQKYPAHVSPTSPLPLPPPPPRSLDKLPSPQSLDKLPSPQSLGKLPPSAEGESAGAEGEIDAVDWKLPVGFDWSSTEEEDCLAQINKIYAYHGMIESALVIQCGWRGQKSRQTVCYMVGMQRGNVIQQMRQARQLAKERAAALQTAQSAKDKVASYATSIQCAFRCHLSRARLVREREYREVFLLNKTQWAIVRLQKSCAKRREMRAFQTARQDRSALRLQCCYRQRMARKRVRLQKENSIASMIQLRMRLWHHFRWMRRSKQILPLQCAVRCFMSRRRLLRKRREIIARESLTLDYDRFAAHLISAACRGIITRRRLREVKAHARQSRSIALLAPFVLGHAARLKLRRLKTEKENSVMRKHYFATKLQNAWRCQVSMDIARDEYLKREASSMLLRHFKGPAARKVFGGLVSRATFAATIQNAFRARLARREARQKRAGRMISTCALRALCRNRMIEVARDVLIHDLAEEIGFDPALVCLHCLEAFAVGARCRLHSGPARAARLGNREETLMQKNAPFMRRAARSGPVDILPRVEFPPWLGRSTKAGRSQTAERGRDRTGIAETVHTAERDSDGTV